ncbi:MAG TPA: NAD-dependent epimerase/dehydratase family protein [Methylomirabilota bacterium]|nr:NAD-dependent epimerase/dehydratase family protein [Methylomirabilota bacterium]
MSKSPPNKNQNVFLVTGGAGFIGSHLIDLLLADSATKEVRVLDNFSSGRREHLQQHKNNSRLKIIKLDLLNLKKALPHFKGVGQVFHLAANPDARWGIENTRLDLEQETIVTYNVLEAMRRNSVPQIIISSSGTVYGDVGTIPTHENFGPALPISLYGSGKVAAEALISAFCATFGLCGIILRFGNIVGERTTHGAIYDFIRRLAKNSAELQVFGNGAQSKPYIYVRDLVGAIVFGGKKCAELGAGKFDVFNVAPDGGTSVRFIAEELIAQLGFKGRTKIIYGTTAGGWPGDVPHSRMDASKLRKAGFVLPRSSDEAVQLSIRRIIEWLPARKNARDSLRLPVDERLAISK